MKKFLCVLLVLFLYPTFTVNADGGYLDYKMICEEMDELMKSAPDEKNHMPGISVFENYKKHPAKTYFENLMDRVKLSTSGPREERIALYVVSDSMNSFFFYRGRVCTHNSVIYKTFHARIKQYLETQTADIFTSLSEASRKSLLRYWNEKK